jgi:hypothetical protein
MATDYDLLLNGVFHESATNPANVQVEHLEGNELYPQQFRVGNCRFCFKDGRLVCIEVSNKRSEQVGRVNVSA